ncbi:Thiol:disulfide interchange protein (Protein-disulfide reductase) [Pandoraea terrae]|uniref:Thiol:disulfide interchange protein (Protein-disulfide reductase) n=1 Tax=Pandoraea terrae TaxID=1537710 RepID=A0A5E4VDE9_9BURK|nr:protein-disulfide reductase DsbD domain-containing protein [Pandoraea terrae]VVE09584.1 Thiol:disulfide interchange protein (Protein-disulfide reductase) [Pandoraea terrae]
MFKKLLVALHLLLALLMVSWSAVILAQPIDASSLLSPDKAFALGVSDVDADSRTMHVTFDIAPGYYLYRERITAVDPHTGAALGVDMPAGEQKHDPNFGDVEIFHGHVALDVKLAGAGHVHLGWQGCAEAGVCFPPQTRTIDVSSAPSSGVASEPPPEASHSTISAVTALGADTSDESIVCTLGDLSPVLALLALFVVGIALAFTPCSWPVLPIVSSMIVGTRASRNVALVLSTVFVVSMSLVYAALGEAASLAGSTVQAVLQSWWANGLFAAVLLLLALSMFGVYQLQLPFALRQLLSGASGRARSGSVVGAMFAGAVSGLLRSVHRQRPDGFFSHPRRRNGRGQSVCRSDAPIRRRGTAYDPPVRQRRQ